MPVDQKQAEAYVNDLIQQFDRDNESVTATERRAILKYRESMAHAGQAAKDADQIKSQIQQAQARLRSLELQIADSQGKANGHLEFLVSMKFEEDEEVAKRAPTSNRNNQVLPLRKHNRKDSAKGSPAQAS